MERRLVAPGVGNWIRDGDCQRPVRFAPTPRQAPLRRQLAFGSLCAAGAWHIPLVGNWPQTFGAATASAPQGGREDRLGAHAIGRRPALRKLSGFKLASHSADADRGSRM